MHFIVKTNIGSNTKEAVMAGFTSELFTSLAPPFPKLKLLRYDGCEKGNEVHLELDFFLYKRKWISVITENKFSSSELFFIDEGKLFPFPIKKWKHKHIIRQLGNSVEIEDNVTYSCGFLLLDLIVYLPFYLLFLYRKPIYLKYF